MGNIIDNTDLTNHVDKIVDESSNTISQNWISQINAGGTVYDIATHHSIKFKDGSNGNSTEWNGLTDLEIVIPTITDIVQTPIVFAGTVGADGNVSWNEKHTDGPKTGYLVFFTADCAKFSDANIACEAGDMAIYDGSKWNVVSGENQVKIVDDTDSTIDDVNRTVVKVGDAKDVLVVEGKALSLTLDYEDLNDNHLSTTSGIVTDIVFDTMTVGSVGVKLNKADDVATTIGEPKSITYGTELANGTVNLTNATGLVNSITWGTFTQGTETKSEKNSAQDLVVSGGDLNLTSKQASGDFVDSVKLADVVKFDVANTDEAGSIKMISTITSAAGAQFFNGIHVTGKDAEGNDETADFTIAGCLAPTEGENAKYVKGLKDSKKPIVGVQTAGSFSIAGGIKDIVTGWGNESATGDVVSSVTVSAVKDASVLKTAKVENHVLSFDAVNVASDVTTTCSYKSLSKAAYTYTPTTLQEGEFDTVGFTKAADVNYTFGRGNETVYNPETKNWKLITPGLNVTYGSYTFEDDGMKAAVPAQTFVTSVTAGQLPTWTGYDYDTTDVTGTVSTALSTASLDFNALTSNSINMPGAYSLDTVDAKDGDITVGKEGALAANSATVDLTGYIKSVSITE